MLDRISQIDIERLGLLYFLYSILLLDKYADEGIENIEDMKILQVNPLDQFGLPMEIVGFFGGKVQYQQALAELEREIYTEMA